MPSPISQAPLEDQTTEFNSRATLDCWTAPPARALHYGAVERLADGYHGWRDGRRALPIVVEAGEREGRAAMSTDGPPSAPPTLLPSVTPWTDELRRAAETRIGEGKVDHEREMAVLLSWFTATSVAPSSQHLTADGGEGTRTALRRSLDATAERRWSSCHRDGAGPSPRDDVRDRPTRPR
ncbi:hypothetical protein GCM10023203_31240 [Actinomycetospora straminea]|uniref:Uncharacterized protein n=1 Tax=Actinomycetospora straminea TaxID=663607 RepID=A0ABP9EJC4_9PSEU